MQISEARLEIEGLKQKLLDNEHLHRTLLEEMQQSIIDENQNEIN
jgi:hypothetical protein